MPHHGKAKALRAAVRRLKAENRRLRRALDGERKAILHRLFCPECMPFHALESKVLCPTGLSLTREARHAAHTADTKTRKGRRQ